MQCNRGPRPGGCQPSGSGRQRDDAGNIYLAGSTQASPTAGAAQALSGGAGYQAGTGFVQQGNSPFVMKMTPSAAPPAFLATVGGSCTGEADSLALDAAGNIWLVGSNGSVDFVLRAPISGLSQKSVQQRRLAQPRLQATAYDGFLAELNHTGSTVLTAMVIDGHFFGAVTADSISVYYGSRPDHPGQH